MAIGFFARIMTAGLALALLSACEEPQLSPSPEPRAAAPAPKAPVLPSKRSMELAEYYASVQRNLLTQGLLRQDGGGPDTPFSKRQLLANFMRIGVSNEFTLEGDRFAERASVGTVQRWIKPVSISMEFGPAVPAQIANADRGFVTRYAGRLSRVTGHRIATTRGTGNFHVAVLTVDELEVFGPRLQELVPGLSDALADQITTMARPIYCAVYAFSDADVPDSFHTAVAIVRAEHPDLLRQSCYHEEIAQGLGLSNDSPAARPSIFNDDDEFALLTRHDELLLQILYDDRLVLGANPAEAQPVVNIIASELLGGES